MRTLILLSLLVFLPAFAGTGVDETPAGEPQAANETHPAGAVHEGANQHAASHHSEGGHPGIHHRHHAGIFFGGNHYESENGFTVGGDYEYRLHRYVGIGAGGEYVAGDFREGVLVFPVYFHPAGDLRIFAGPGLEHRFAREGEEGEAHGEEEMPERENNFLFRLGVTYDIFIKKFAVSPGVSVDFVDGKQVLVYGVTFGIGF